LIRGSKNRVAESPTHSIIVSLSSAIVFTYACRDHIYLYLSLFEEDICQKK